MDTKNENWLSEVTESVRKFAMAFVTEGRYKHSVRVAQTCAALCGRYGLSERRGFFAGISHDICKNMEDELLLKIASRDGKKISKMEKAKPALLHGRAAAVKLFEDWKVRDTEILEAVANHTFGKVGMCDLAKLLYVADKIEPGRENVTPEYTERLFKMDINSLTLFVAKESVAYLKGRGKKISQETRAFCKWLKGMKNAN